MDGQGLISLLHGHRADTVLAWWQGRVVTAGEFLQHVDFVAQNLPQSGAAVNLCEDRYLFMVAFVALSLREQVNILPSTRAPQVVTEVSADYGAGYYLAEQALPGVMLDFHQMKLPPAVMETDELAALQVAPGRLAAVLYTSGSTGKPSPNPKTWQNLVTGSAAIRQGLGLVQLSGATLVATVPAQHMFGLETTVLLPLLGGMAVHSGRPFFPEDIRRTLESVPEPRLLITTPLHVRACVEAGLEWPTLSRVITATAPLKKSLALEAERKLGCELTEIYGSTETGALASRHPAVEDSWRALPEVRFTAESSSVYVSAPFLSHPVRLNDVIELHADASFLLHGRHADMVKIAGKRASLGDLTHKLLQIGGVEDAVIFHLDEDEGGVSRLCALVVAPQLDISSLQRELLQRFDPAFIPRPLYRVEKLPRNAAGKLPRSELLAMLRLLRGRHEGE